VKLAAVIASALILFAMTGPGRASDVSTLRGFGTAIVDGVLTVNEWEGAGRFAFQAQGGQGTFYVMNDSQNLYLALRAPDPHVGASVFDGIFLAPPPNVFGAGSDNLHVTPGTFEDLFNRQVTPTYWDWLADVADGGTRDGLAVVRTADGELVYEIAHSAQQRGQPARLQPADPLAYLVHGRVSVLPRLWDRVVHPCLDRWSDRHRLRHSRPARDDDHRGAGGRGRGARIRAICIRWGR
jgi:hypothetical protein